MTTTTATIYKCNACLDTGWDNAFDSACHCGQIAARQADHAATVAHAYSVYESRIIDQQDAETLLLTFLQTATWSDFAQSLAKQWASKGSLSAKQLAAATSMKAKCDATAAAKAAKATTHAGKVAQEVTSGIWTAGDIVAKIRISKSTGRPYPMVLDGESWIYPEGRARDIMDTLRFDGRQVTLDEAKDHGRRTGNCMICNRELTDPNSIAAGIGPICAKGF